MDRDDYEIVLAVAGLGSLPAAARALGLDVAVARQRLDALERAKGVALFSHDPQGSTPTPVGLRLAMLAQTLKTPAQTTPAASWPATAPLAGRVRVMSHSAMTAALLQPAISALTGVHANLRIEMSVARRIQDLDNGDMDIVVRNSEPTRRYAVSRRVSPITLGLYARHDYLAAFGVPATAGALRGHSLVVQGSDAAVRSTLVALGLHDVLGVSDIAVRTQSAMGSLQSAEAGQGIAPLRLSQVEDSDGLARVLPEIEANLNLRLVTPQHLSSLAHVRTVCDVFRRSLQSMSDPQAAEGAESPGERQAA